MLVRVLQSDRVAGLVDREHGRARDFGAVVEDADRAVRPAARVVLPCERRRRRDLEVAVLAAEPPHDRAGLAVELVDRVRVAAGDEQVLVAVDGDRVQVDVVPVAAERPVGLDNRDVVEAAPLQQHLARGDVDLLEHRVLDRPVPRATDCAQISRRDRVGRQQCRAAAGDQELMQVALVAVARVDVRDRRVGRVGDHVLADAVTELDRPLPPRQDRRALEGLHAKIGRDQAGQRLLPHRLPGVVDDHRSRLRAVRCVVGREEDQARRNQMPRGLDREPGHLEVRPGAVPGGPRSICAADESAEQPGGATVGGWQGQRPDRRSSREQQGSARHAGRPGGDGRLRCRDAVDARSCGRTTAGPLAEPIPVGAGSRRYARPRHPSVPFSG